MVDKKRALDYHRKHRGKVEVVSRGALENLEDLGLAYTPGVAEPCLAIKEDPSAVFEYTCKGRMVAVVTDGSAVLGLGNIGPQAALPVMEGKAVLFKTFGDIDAFPLCLDTQDTEEITRAVQFLAPTFGGINLEDIAAPRCFDIERRLEETLDIPVFHDDQHGTAIVCLAGLINALKVVGKKIEEVTAVINGAGAAGNAIAKLLVQARIEDVIVCDRRGIIHRGRLGLDQYKEELAEITNRRGISGDLAEAIKGRDVFIGVSAPGQVTKEMVSTMAKDPIIFAMANPVPEIFPDEAIAAGAKVVGTGRSDFPNQVNNVLAFPGIFKGALKVRASKINHEMKLAAAYAIADIISPEELSPDYCIPGVFDKRVATQVAMAVAKAAIETGVARELSLNPEC
jgi:malate dehydrogenase (oxaloacetate-decarboxylating)